MNDQPITPRPVNSSDKLLREKFYESICAQGELLDRVSGHLLVIELAVPGIYAAALKVVRGEAATSTLNAAFYFSFGCWLLALALTLAAITPKNWEVRPDILRQDPARYSDGLGIVDFFEKSAQYKRRLVIASSILFFAGAAGAAFTLG